MKTVIVFFLVEFALGTVTKGYIEDCSQLACPKIDGEQPVYAPLINCIQFCQCSNGVAYTQNCSAGLQFNPALNVCDWPANVGCTENSSSSSDKEDENNGSNGNNNNDSDGDANKSGDACIASGIDCPAVDGEYPVYGALSNCSQFCQCSNGKPYLHNCSVGLHFNPILNVCDWPYRAGCEGNSDPTTEQITGSSSTSAETTQKDGSGGDDNPTDVCLHSGLKCPFVDGEYPVYGALANCSQFCQCSNGKPYLHNCSAGLHFNPILNACDWPYRAGCKGNSSITNNSDICDCNNSSITRDVCLDSGIVCSLIEGEYPVYGALANCSQFCQCSNGKPYLHDCPSGLHFNPALNVCDWPYRAGCRGNNFNNGRNTVKNPNGCNCNNSSTTGDVCVDSGIKCPIVDGEYPVYGALSNLSQFCQCSNGKPYLHECSYGLQFNSKLNVCDWPSHSEISEDEYEDFYDEFDCEEIPLQTYGLNLDFSLPKSSDNVNCEGINCPDIIGDYTIFAPAVNCSQFCKCSNGVVKVVDCPPGNRFNQELNICDFAENVECL